MQRITSYTSQHLHTAAQTRALERQLTALLPRNTLMNRAGAAVARLGKALAPHARCVWVACGPGNNGGDGLAAAAQLQPWAMANGIELLVTWSGNEAHLPADALNALQQARASGVRFVKTAPTHCDLVIDAVLGLGVRTQNSERDNTNPYTHALVKQVSACTGLRLCVDIPSGLNPDTGSMTVANNSIPSSAKALFTLTFLTLKPGLFTADGRDASGEIWFDDLGAEAAQVNPGNLWLGSSQQSKTLATRMRHSSHKGSHGDVWLVGGQHLSHNGTGMTGAVVLAARAALHAGAGRVFVVPLGPSAVDWDAVQPELMFRSPDVLSGPGPLAGGCWVCGCGGGELVKAHVARLARDAHTLVLDADALNAMSDDPGMAEAVRERQDRGQLTVLTPHPLEAARLLGQTTAHVQTDRVHSARALAHKFGALCVLKGSGTVTATPSGKTVINNSGNGRLATAGTGDVLAGMLGAALAQLHASNQAPSTHSRDTNEQMAMDTTVLGMVTDTVWRHGHVADNWEGQDPTLTANRLSNALRG